MVWTCLYPPISNWDVDFGSPGPRAAYRARTDGPRLIITRDLREIFFWACLCGAGQRWLSRFKEEYEAYAHFKSPNSDVFEFLLNGLSHLLAAVVCYLNARFVPVILASSNALVVFLAFPDLLLIEAGLTGVSRGGALPWFLAFCFTGFTSVRYSWGVYYLYGVFVDNH